MRNRTPDSTTLSPAQRLADSRVWFITERGLRASGAERMKAAAAKLRKTAAELEEAALCLDQDMPVSSRGSGATPGDNMAVYRRIRVSGQYQKEHQVPALRLAGKWLRRVGFELGQKVIVREGKRHLTLFVE